MPLGGVLVESREIEKRFAIPMKVARQLISSDSGQRLAGLRQLGACPEIATSPTQNRCRGLLFYFVAISESGDS